MTTSHATRVELRRLAIATSALTAVLYLLIGLELLYIGESTSGADPGLLGFGLVMSGTFAVATALLALLPPWRWVWIAVAVLNALVIVGYFALADARTPPFEWPGLLVKAVQLVTLLATGMLAFSHEEAREAPGTASV
jgi:peptidoglycan/LPS O-acetylase OafA/YrhL